MKNEEYQHAMQYPKDSPELRIKAFEHLTQWALDTLFKNGVLTQSCKVEVFSKNFPKLFFPRQKEDEEGLALRVTRL